MKFRCPRCNKYFKPANTQTPSSSPFFPFCCERCQLVDLGGWLCESYRIASSPDEQQDNPPQTEIKCDEGF